jgi:hypothetical protein
MSSLRPKRPAQIRVPPTAVREADLPVFRSLPWEAPSRQVESGLVMRLPILSARVGSHPGTNQHSRWAGRPGWSQRMGRSGVSDPTRTRRTMSSCHSQIRPGHASLAEPLSTKTSAGRGSRTALRSQKSSSSTRRVAVNRRSHLRSRFHPSLQHPSRGVQGMNSRPGARTCPLTKLRSSHVLRSPASQGSIDRVVLAETTLLLPRRRSRAYGSIRYQS